MYFYFLVTHSILRWLVLATLVYAIYRSYTGYTGSREFSKHDNSIRHWTATIAHIQMMVGMIVYVKSPLVKTFWQNSSGELDPGFRFFGLYHIGLMLVSVVLITIGSSLSKRQKTDKLKFRTMLIWFSFALLIILIAIPWSFSPLAQRPFIRL